MEAAAAVLPTLVPSGSAVVSRRSSLATVVPLVCCGLLHIDRSLCTCVLALCCAGGGAPRLPRVSRRRWSHPPREARRRSPTPGLLSPPLSLQRYLLLPLFPESSGQPAELFDRLPLILVWLAGLLSLLLLLGLSAFGVYMGWMSPTVSSCGLASLCPVLVPCALGVFFCSTAVLIVLQFNKDRATILFRWASVVKFLL
jgi:hypothetical protein